MVLTLELLTELEIEAIKNLAYLLDSLDFNNAVLVNYYSFKIQGYDVDPWDKPPQLDVVVDKDNLPWQTEDEKIREIMPPRDSQYYEPWKNFILKYGSTFPLHLIPEPRAMVIKLDDEYQFSTGERLRVCKPVMNVLGFKEAIAEYCRKADEYQEKLFDEQEVERWKRKIRNVESAARKKEDKELISACGECNKQLEILYRK